MHIDLNSCFASVEQQTNPFLRSKPIAVAAYDSPGGCILSPSGEAKALGIKTGMRVAEGKLLCPSLKVLTPDPGKYRRVHLSLRPLMADYTDNWAPKSIDEFVLDFDDQPLPDSGLIGIAMDIKKRIKSEIGELLTVSIGLGPNRFLAKTASNLKKPDGLETIDKNNFLAVYKRLTLTDLTGINKRNEIRLRRVDIKTVLDFYRADLLKLRSAFLSVNAYYWYLRLRGWEIDGVELARRSFGNSYALPANTSQEAMRAGLPVLLPILQKLVEKTGARMRTAGYKASGVRVSLSFRDGSFWRRNRALKKEIFDSRDIFREAVEVLKTCPRTRPVAILAVSCFRLSSSRTLQTELFCDVYKNKRLIKAVDKLNRRWGAFTLTPARQLMLKQEIHDRISFGGVREL